MTFSVTDMLATETAIDGLLTFTMKQVTDDRGTVREFYRDSSYGPSLADAAGANPTWRQINITETRHGAVRGLHGEAMTKLVACVAGSAYGAYLDARPDSPTYGVLVTAELEPGTQVLVPAGVCNGFQAVSSPGCQYLYCFTSEWVLGMAGTAYNPLDPALGLNWPVPIDPANPAQISAKDAGAPAFRRQGS